MTKGGTCPLERWKTDNTTRETEEEKMNDQREEAGGGEHSLRAQSEWFTKSGAISHSILLRGTCENVEVHDSSPVTCTPCRKPWN